MVEIPSDVQTLYTGVVQKRHLPNGEEEYYVSVPDREVELGDVENGEPVRVCLLATEGGSSAESTDTDGSQVSQQKGEGGSNTADSRSESQQIPPVSEGDELTVEIRSVGDQGDGIAKVDRGFVVIVPDTNVGETVDVKITSVKDSVAFAEVVGDSVATH